MPIQVWIVYYSDHTTYTANYEDGWVMILGCFRDAQKAEQFLSQQKEDEDCIFITKTVLQ